jgi:uncharacterized membrane protein YoaK (UPF0700 family)
MDNNVTNEKNVNPSILGASILFGIIIGTAFSGFMGKFELWIPIFGTAGLIIGLYLSKSKENNTNDSTSEEKK